LLKQAPSAGALIADKLKSQLEKHRIARGIEGETQTEPDHKEEELKRTLESEKAR
jgi:hypothetical protein